MPDLYTATVFITVFTLVITAVDSITNHLVSKKNKTAVVFLCLFIGIAICCEWIGVKTNGADRSLILLHKIAKLVEFSIAPIIGFTSAIAYGEVTKKNFAVAVSAIHAVFEIAAVPNCWVFSVDAENIYHREGLYWIYIVVFVTSVIYSFFCIVKKGKKYQARFGSVLILILCFLATGVSIQMLHSEIRIDFMCVAIGNLLLYNYSGNVVHQIDAITRLLNRSCYDKRIENIKSPAYILIFDINKFKKINDTYGHIEGDKCLAMVARQIYAVYGKYGSCYRIGGDEFCVILYRQMNKLAELNSLFENAVKQLRVKNEHISGVALGYAYYGGEKTDIHTAIEEADEMMYKNKQ